MNPTVQEKASSSEYPKLHRFAWIILIAGVLAIVLIWLAMPCYAEPYDFYRNFLSAMGRTRINNGAVDNLPACLVFNAGLVIAGVGTGAYFFMRGRMGKKWPGIPLLILGSVGGLLLAATGLIPFDLWPDGHNYSIFTAGGLISVSLLLCGVEGDSVFSSRENNISWLCMTVFVGLFWVMIVQLAVRRMLSHAGVLQQKLIVFYLWFFMIRHAVLLLKRSAPKVPPVKCK